MATLGFSNDYHDPVIVDTSLLNESLGENDRPEYGGGNIPSPDFSNGPGPGGGPDIVNQDVASAAGAGDTRKRGLGDMFSSPADIQGQGLNQGNWMGAQGYAGNVNRQTADRFANLSSDQAANIPGITSGDQPMTGADVQRMGLHQDDFSAAQRYADSVNRQKGATFANLTPDQVSVMNTPPKPSLPDMANLPPPTGATGGFGNYNPRLGSTVDQTYGKGAGQPGTDTLAAAGFKRQGDTRLVIGPDGTQYVTDANGFLNPDQQRARDWQSRANIDVNATTQFAPDAIEKIRYLDSVGLATPEEKRFLQTIGSGEDFAQTQPYADYVNRHNEQARSLGLNDKQLQAPARVVPMDQAFPVLKEYGDLLRQLGASNVSIRPDNHTVYQVGTDTPIMQWRSSNNNNYALSGDTPLANVLDDVAKLRQIAAAQQAQTQQAAQSGGDAGYGGGTRRSSSYGGGGAGYGGSGAATSVQGGPPQMVTGENLYAGPGGTQPNMLGYGPPDANIYPGGAAGRAAAEQAAAVRRALASGEPIPGSPTIPAAVPWGGGIPPAPTGYIDQTGFDTSIPPAPTGYVDQTGWNGGYGSNAPAPVGYSDAANVGYSQLGNSPVWASDDRTLGIIPTDIQFRPGTGKPNVPINPGSGWYDEGGIFHPA